MGTIKTNNIQPLAAIDSFSITRGDGTTNRINVNASGNVGVGTTSQVAKLDVIGNIRCSAQPINAADVVRKDYADVAYGVGKTIAFAMNFELEYLNPLTLNEFPAKAGFTKPANSGVITIPSGTTWVGIATVHIAGATMSATQTINSSGSVTITALNAVTKIGTMILTRTV